MGCWTHGPVVACLLACWQSGRVLRSYVAVHIFTMCITKYDRHATDWLTPCFWRWKMLGFFMEGILLQCFDVEYYLMSNLWCFASDSFLNVSPKSWERHMGPRASNWRMIWNVISVLLVVMMQPRLNLDLSVHPKYSFRNLAQTNSFGRKKNPISEVIRKRNFQKLLKVARRAAIKAFDACFTEEVLGQSSNASMPGDGPAAASSPVELGIDPKLWPFSTIFQHALTLKHWLLPW